MKRNNQKLISLSFLLIILLSTSACSSKGYWSDRGRDALDIVTVGVGMGVGAKAQLGPLQAGALFEADGYTLRGSELTSGGLINNGEWQTLAIGEQQFVTTELDRNKNYSAATTIDQQTIPFIYRLKCPDKAAYWYYTQIEAVLAAGPALRLGFNPGELVDFILGWASVDIMSDDLMSDAAKIADENEFQACSLESRTRKLALE